MFNTFTTGLTAFEEREKKNTINIPKDMKTKKGKI